MAETTVVPDASVLLKWVLRSGGEEDGDRALALKTAWLAGRCRVVVPTLWAYEVGNILGLKQPASAGALFDAMVDLQMPEESPAASAKEIFRLMREYGGTFYDAVYHALAIRERGTMVTADSRYARRAGRAGHLCLLSGWTPPGVSM